MAGQNIKNKYLMCYIPVKMLKQHAMPNWSLQNSKIYSIKGCGETSPRWIMYVATTVILKVWICSGNFFISDHGFLLCLVNTTTSDTDEYYVRCYKVNDVKTFKILVISFYALRSKSYVNCRLALSTGAFKNHVDLMLYIIEFD